MSVVALTTLWWLFHVIMPCAGQVRIIPEGTEHPIEVLTEVESGHMVERVTWLRPEQRVHLLLNKDIPNHWFLFALKNVKDKELTIEIQGQTTMHSFGAWRGVQPFVADTLDLSNPILYNESAYQARYGKLPWRRIENARYEDEFHTLTITTKFAANEATIALKYPCPVSYVENYLTNLTPRVNPNLLGQYQAGHLKGEPVLRVLTIPSMEGANAARWKEKPTVLLYGGEHATEHESSHAVMGALEWLLSDDPQARFYREKVNVLLIPHLFPYDTTISRFNILTEGFFPSPHYVTGEVHELWAQFFNRYIDEGHFVDAVFSIHNTAGSETVNFYCPLVQQVDDDKKYTVPLNDAVMASVQRLGWTIDTKRGREGDWRMRLSGWLGASFDSAALFYEVNGQRPDKRLSLRQVRAAGPALLQGAQTFFESPLFAQLREREKKRFALRQQNKIENPLNSTYDPNNPPYWWTFNIFF